MADPSDEALARMLQEQDNNEYDAIYGDSNDDNNNESNDDSDDYNPNPTKKKSKKKAKKPKAKAKQTKSKNKNKNSKSSKSDKDTEGDNSNTNKENLNSANATSTKSGKKRKRAETDIDNDSNENETEISENNGDNSNNESAQPPPGKKRRINTKSKKTGAGKSKAKAKPKGKGKRQWSEEDERLFGEALEKHGRNWKEVIKYMKTDRNEGSIRSHAQVYFVKMLKNRQELPAKVKETGDGYTLSGKPLNKYGSITLKVFASPDDVPMDMGGVESDEESANKLKRKNEDGSIKETKAKKAKKKKEEKDVSPKKKGKRGRKSNKNNDISDDDEYNPGNNSNADAIMASAMGGNLRRSTRERKNTRKLNNNSIDDDEYQLRGDIEQYAPFGEIKNDHSQPFEIVWCPNALLVADLHSHLCRDVEIMGILAGYYDESNKKVYILKCYPLREEVQRPKTVTADTMDMHYISQMINNETCLINNIKYPMRILGWYHSHPEFENYPSNTDLSQHNAQKQHCCELESPYIGLILASWSSNGYGAEYMWFNTIKEETGNFLPMQFNVRKEKHIDINHPSLLKQIRDLIVRYSEDRYKKYRSDLGTIWKAIFTEERTQTSLLTSTEKQSANEKTKSTQDDDDEEEDEDIDICNNNSNNDDIKSGEDDIAVTTDTIVTKVRQVEKKVQRFEKILESLLNNMDSVLANDDRKEKEQNSQNNNSNSNSNDNSNDNSGEVDINRIDVTHNFMDYVKGIFYENFDRWWKRSDKPSEKEVTSTIVKNNKNKEWIAAAAYESKTVESDNEQDIDIDIDINVNTNNKSKNDNNNNDNSINSVDITDTTQHVNKMTLEQESNDNIAVDCKDVE